MKSRGAIARYDARNAAQLGPLFEGLGDPGYYYPTTATLQVLACHATSLQPEDRPRRFGDLADPKWRGRLAVGHPGFSGCTGSWALSLQKLYGWEFFEKLAKNNPRVGRSAVDPVTLMSAGEAVTLAAGGACCAVAGDAIMLPRASAASWSSRSTTMSRSPVTATS